MEKIDYFEIAENNSLTVFSGVYSPEYAEEVIENPSRITGIRFVYKTEQGTVNAKMEQELLKEGYDSDVAKLTATRGEKFKSEFYFVGKIVGFDEVQSIVGDSEKKFEKYAVSYDENGDVFDIRPIFSDIETVIPVKDQAELETVYFQKTGKSISIGAPSSGKTM